MRDDRGERVEARRLLDDGGRTGRRVTTAGRVQAISPGLVAVVPLDGPGVLRCIVRGDALVQINASELREGAVVAVNGRVGRSERGALELLDCRFRGGR